MESITLTEGSTYCSGLETAGLSSAIGLDDNRRNIVVLEITLHERPSRMIDAIRDSRSRIVAEGPNLIKDTLGAELVTIWRGRLRDPIG